MATKVVQLTDVPQLISTKAAYIDGANNEFKFAFGTTAPTDLNIYHTAYKLWSDGSLGSVYAWNAGRMAVRMVVSEAAV